MQFLLLAFDGIDSAASERRTGVYQEHPEKILKKLNNRYEHRKIQTGSR
jgi:hypothetical protein